MDQLPEKIVINVYSNGEYDVYIANECRSLEHEDRMLLENELNTSAREVPPLPFVVKQTSFDHVQTNNDESNIHQKLKPFVCKHCGKQFTLKGNLKVHMRTHTGERPFICTECGRGFRQKITLQIHLRGHTGERPYFCKVCRQKFAKKAHLVSHMRVHSREMPFSCGECGKAYRIKESLTSHVRNYGSLEHYSCSFCRKIFREKLYFDNHLRLHTVDRPFVCDDCGKRFSVKVNLDLHVKTHKRVRPFTCRECGDRFSERKYLKKHARTHKALKPFLCKICGNRYALKALLRLHSGSHTKVKRFSCRYCNKRFSSNPLLGGHMLQHRQKRKKFPHLSSFNICQENVLERYNARTNKELITVSTNVCKENRRLKGYNFGQSSVTNDLGKESSMAVHKSYEDNFLSFDSNIKEAQENLLPFHETKGSSCKKEVNQADFKPFTVMKYGKFGNQKTEVGLHVKASSDDTPLTCKDCGAELFTRGKLDSFMKNDGKESSFTCNQCGKRYQMRRSLVYYTVTHKGTKPLQFSSLNKKEIYMKKSTKIFPDSFSNNLLSGQEIQNSFNVADYSRANVENDIGKPFVCKECGQHFKMKSLLNLHSSSHLRDRPFACSHCGKKFSSKPFLGKHIRKHKQNKHSFNDGSAVLPECNPMDSKIVRAESLLFSTESAENVENSHASELNQCHLKESSMEKMEYSDLADKHSRSDCLMLTENSETKYGSSIPRDRGINSSPEHIVTLTSTANAEKFYADNSNKVTLKTENKPFLCQICGKGFVLEENLEIHVQNHSGVKPFPCQVCGRGFNVERNLQLHMKIHTHGKPFTCRHCGRGFSCKKSLESHAMIHTKDVPIVCVDCGEEQSDKADLLKHMKIHMRKKSFKCGECGKMYLNKKSFDFHVERHKTNQSFACDICGLQFVKKRDMDKHKVTHTKRPFLCKVCGECFSLKEILNMHMKTHVSKSYTCDECRKEFTSEDLLQLHQCSQASGSLLAEDVSMREVIKKGSFTSKAGNHSKSRLLQLEAAANSVIKEEKAIKCETTSEELVLSSQCSTTSGIEVCEITSVDDSYLGRSLVKKEASDLVDKALKDSSKAATECGEVTSFKCEKCSESFTKRRSLNFHLKLHSLRKPFSCRDCKKEFVAERTLLKHQEKYHSKS